jgi:hypothetical protein
MDFKVLRFLWWPKFVVSNNETRFKGNLLFAVESYFLANPTSCFVNPLFIGIFLCSPSARTKPFPSFITRVGVAFHLQIVYTSAIDLLLPQLIAIRSTVASEIGFCLKCFYEFIGKVKRYPGKGWGAVLYFPNPSNKFANFTVILISIPLQIIVTSVSND